MENTDIIDKIDKSEDGTYSVVSRRRSIPYHEYYKIYNLEVQRRINNPIIIEELPWYQKVGRCFTSCVQYLCRTNSPTVRPSTVRPRTPHRVPSVPTPSTLRPHKAPSGKGATSSHKGRNE